MMGNIRQDIIHNIKNIPGWHTRRKIVIIECDDWGGTRMPSKEVYELLTAKGLKVGQGWFNMYDTLESKKDLEPLFDVLTSVRDRNGNPSIMTPVTNVANPDFEKIRASGFSGYHYEPFTETLKRYYPDEDVFRLWEEGISSGIFVPELHGREHLTVQMWMEKLKEGNKDLLIAFDHGFTALEIEDIPPPAREFRAEFYFTSEDQKSFLVDSLKEAVSLFSNIFGQQPRVFVPGNGIFHPDFEHVIAGRGIKFLYVNRASAYPDNGGELKYRHMVTGQKGPHGLIYYTRNCAFEPSDINYKGIDLTLKQIAAAFRWGKPANISTHRVNFIGGINPVNRENGLSELRKLLRAIVHKWPDVEFMSSGDALEYMKNKN
ncbi:MAG: hypothetical protein RQ743_11965 [Bacteroidales bacterium]|nr:hypothetical protein [Bacteroidales bacterium]